MTRRIPPWVYGAGDTRWMPAVVAIGVVLGVALGGVGPGAARSIAFATSPAAEVVSATDWEWPVGPFRLERPYEAPAHRYGSGHRGADLRPLDSALVRAPAAGRIAFVGAVADRGVLTIDHGDGFVTTLEPISSTLEPGMAVERGDPVGTMTRGGHTVAGTLHFGVRLHGEYINPMVLLGDVPRAVLLPCC